LDTQTASDEIGPAFSTDVTVQGFYSSKLLVLLKDIRENYSNDKR
jgi:hypothetical protein